MPRQRAPLEPPSGVVFDLDGLLVDSERLARDAWVAACLAIGVPFQEAAYAQCVGSNNVQTEQILRAAYGPGFDYDAAHQHWQQHYRAAVDADLVVKAGARELLSQLQTMGLPIALATSSRRVMAEKKLKRVGLWEFFEFTVCGGETDAGKPAPDPYLAAVAGISQAPHQCWAFEDSDNGTRAAVAAGLTVFQVPDLIPPSAEVLAFGHRQLASLTDAAVLLAVATGRGL